MNQIGPIYNPLKDLKRIGRGFLNLIYPDLCEYCRNEIKIEDHYFCMQCLCQLPFTRFKNEVNNQFTTHFEGRINLVYGDALFYLVQGGNVERMLYRLKYKNQSYLGVELGKFYGELIFENKKFEGITGIIPVPLHQKKEKIRGYNQSERIANGLARSLKIPVLNDMIRRKIFTKTQTKMNRVQRIKNTQNAFELVNLQKINEGHFLLIDDVLTTGSTLQACASQLLSIKGIKISMATLAIGS